MGGYISFSRHGDSFTGDCPKRLELLRPRCAVEWCSGHRRRSKILASIAEAAVGLRSQLNHNVAPNPADLTLRLSSCHFPDGSTNKVSGQNSDSKKPSK